MDNDDATSIAHDDTLLYILQWRIKNVKIYIELSLMKTGVDVVLCWGRFGISDAKERTYVWVLFYPLHVINI